MEEETTRPNANYQLSGRPYAEEEVTYYYNRERRLAGASQSVRDIYAEKSPKRFGALRSLVGGRAGAMLFFPIAILCVALWVLSAFGYFGKGYALDGNNIVITAAHYEGMAIITLKKSVKKNAAAPYSGAVDIEASPAAWNGKMPGVFSHRLMFSPASKEDFSFTAPFDSAELVISVQTETGGIRAKVKSR